MTRDAALSPKWRSGSAAKSQDQRWRYKSEKAQVQLVLSGFFPVTAFCFTSRTATQTWQDGSGFLGVGSPSALCVCLSLALSSSLL